MLPPDIVALAQTVVPGDGDVRLRLLGTGLFNATYLAIRGGVEFALRVPADSAPTAQDRAWEIRVLEQMSRVGLAPPLLYADQVSGTLLQAWVRGEPWSEQDARSLDSLQEMAQLLCAIHAQPMPPRPRRMDPAGWIEYYTRSLAPKASGAAAAFKEPAARALAALDALPAPAAPVVCHSDLHRLNVLKRAPGREGNGLLLLDWEYAHVADGCWDLASWSANTDLSDEAQSTLLTAYGGAAPSESQWIRFKLYCWLYDYICLLWIELYARLRSVESKAFAPRAAWLERRLRLPVYGTITG